MACAYVRGALRIPEAPTPAGYHLPVLPVAIAVIAAVIRQRGGAFAK
jgi:hypothetical protein